MSMCVFRLIPDTTNLDEPYQNQYKMNQTASLRSDTRPETTGTTGRNQSERPTAINRNDRPQTSEYADQAIPAHHPTDLHVKRDGQRVRQRLQHFPLSQPRVMNSVASDGIDEGFGSGVDSLQRRTVQISKADEPLALPDDPTNHVLHAPLHLAFVPGASGAGGIDDEANLISVSLVGVVQHSPRRSEEHTSELQSRGH